MIEKALEKIRAMTVSEMTASLVNLDNVPAGADYLLADPYTQSIETRTKTPPPLGAKFECLDAFVDAIKELHGAGVFAKSIVFWSHGEGYCFQPKQADHPYKRDSLAMRLWIDPRFAKLQALSACRNPLGHKAFNRMLSVDLVDTMDEETRLQLRSLGFTRENNAKSDIQVTKNTHSRDIKAECVAGEKGLPEYIDLTLRCYRDLGPSSIWLPDVVSMDDPETGTGEDVEAALSAIDVTVRCALHVDLDEETLDLQPLPGEVAKALNGTDDLICKSMRHDLETVKTTVLIGEPIDFPGRR